MSRKDPFLSFNFAVEIKGLVVGGFNEVSGLQDETEVQDYREGGVNEYIQRAYPVKWVGPNLRATTAEVAVETLELAHDGLTPQ